LIPTHAIFGLLLPGGLRAAGAAPTPDAGYLGGALQDMQAQQAMPAHAPSLLPTLLNIVVSLLVVVLLIYAFLWLLRRWQSSRQASGLGAEEAADRSLHILNRAWFDNQRGVALVEAGNEVFVVGLGQDITLLGRISDPEQVERLRSASPGPGLLRSFPQQLDKVAGLLRQKQWTKSRKSIKTQADQLKEQAAKLRDLGSREDQR
jgi:flagellar protein FliO/FliZ